MDRIEDNVKRLLNGDAMKETQEFCDFTLEAQNEATGIHISVLLIFYLRLIYSVSIYVNFSILETACFWN